MRSQEQIQRWINSCLTTLGNPNTSSFVKCHDRSVAVALLWVLGNSYEEAWIIVDSAKSGDAAELASLIERPQG